MYLLIIVFGLIVCPLLSAGVGIGIYYYLGLTNHSLPDHALEIIVISWVSIGLISGLSLVCRATRIELIVYEHERRENRSWVASMALKLFAAIDYFWDVRAPYGGMTLRQLKRRNRWINVVATVIMFASLGLPLYLSDIDTDGRVAWFATLTLTSMVSLPAMFVMLVTIPYGISRFYEFASYYEIANGFGWRGLFSLYGIAIVLWAISVAKVLPWHKVLG